VRICLRNPVNDVYVSCELTRGKNEVKGDIRSKSRQFAGGRARPSGSLLKLCIIRMSWTIAMRNLLRRDTL